MTRASVVPTALGPLGVAWTEHGLSRVLLPFAPEARDAPDVVMQKRLVRDGAELVDHARSPWCARLAAHLEGDAVAFDDLPIDETGLSEFARRVSLATRRIPRGQTSTYGEIACAIGTIGRGAPRAIGMALGRNPTPIVVPCHRVVGSDGSGGFSAPGGASTKAQLLVVEGGALGDPEHRLARKHLAKIDPLLAPFVRAIPCTLPVRPNGALFRTIVRAIAGQQLSTKAAATIFGRLETALGIEARLVAIEDSTWQKPRAWPADVPTRVLATSLEALRAVGLSNAKAASLHDLAGKVRDGSLDLDRITRAPDERVIESLRAVRGIGRWTAEMLLIFDLGRPDVLPVDDLGVRKGLQKVHGLRTLPDAATMTKRAEAWRPWRSIGSWYLWRSLDAAL